MPDDTAPATKRDIDRLHDRMDSMAESMQALAEQSAAVNERCKIRGDMILSLTQDLHGKPGNGDAPGMIRRVDANTRHRERVCWWLKQGLRFVTAIAVAVIGAATAWAFGAIKLPW